MPDLRRADSDLESVHDAAAHVADEKRTAVGGESTGSQQRAAGGAVAQARERLTVVRELPDAAMLRVGDEHRAVFHRRHVGRVSQFAPAHPNEPAHLPDTRGPPRTGTPRQAYTRLSHWADRRRTRPRDSSLDSGRRAKLPRITGSGLFTIGPQPFTEPEVRPAMKSFCRTRNIARTGVTATSVPAMIMPYSVWYGPRSCATATASGNF